MPHCTLVYSSTKVLSILPSPTPPWWAWLGQSMYWSKVLKHNEKNVKLIKNWTHNRNILFSEIFFINLIKLSILFRLIPACCATLIRFMFLFLYPCSCRLCSVSSVVCFCCWRLASAPDVDSAPSSCILTCCSDKQMERQNKLCF